MWQKEWENTLQAARDELCIDKGFIIFLTGAALSSVLLFVFEAYLKIMDALEVFELVLEVCLVIGGYLVHRRRLSRGAAGLAALAFGLGALMATYCIMSKLQAMDRTKSSTTPGHWAPTTDPHSKDWVTFVQLNAVFTVVTAFLHITLALWTLLLARCYSRSPLSPREILRLARPLDQSAELEAGAFCESLMSPESESFARAYESRLQDGPVFTHNMPTHQFRQSGSSNKLTASQ
jgi:hypothetical protein